MDTVKNLGCGLIVLAVIGGIVWAAIKFPGFGIGFIAFVVAVCMGILAIAIGRWVREDILPPGR